MWLLDELLKYKDNTNIAIINRKQSLDYKNLWSKSEAISGWLKYNGKNFISLIIIPPLLYMEIKKSIFFHVCMQV